MQTIYIGDNLHDSSNPAFWEEKEKQTFRYVFEELVRLTETSNISTSNDCPKLHLLSSHEKRKKEKNKKKKQKKNANIILLLVDVWFCHFFTTKQYKRQ